MWIAPARALGILRNCDDALPDRLCSALWIDESHAALANKSLRDRRGFLHRRPLPRLELRKVFGDVANVLFREGFGNQRHPLREVTAGIAAEISHLLDEVIGGETRDRSRLRMPLAIHQV